MTENLEGRVSAVIPARNEEESIARAVRSVAAQRGIREILVVDDQSEDRTAEILEGLKGEIPVLGIIRLESLPPGWLGKTYALATAAKIARGEWLLFTDADTEHSPGSLAALLERAEKERTDLLSLSPGQQTPTWWEKSIIPQVYVRLTKLYPFQEVSDPSSPIAAANGQYILIRRSAYERAGGHEAVRAEILEDVELARCVKASGGRVLFVPGACRVRTRMYKTFSEMWRGWTKNLYLLYGRSIGRVLLTLGEVWLLDVLPTLAYLSLCLLAALGRGSEVTFAFGVGCLSLVLWRLESYKRLLTGLGFDPVLANYQFVGAGLFGLLLLNSTRAHHVRGSVRWKGRNYSTRKAVL